MSHLRITASKMFALEMVRTALRNAAIGPEYNLDGMWMYVDMEMTDGNSTRVDILIRIYGAPSRIRASCNIMREGEDWMHGFCLIHLLDSGPEALWHFDCGVVGNRIVATLN